MANQAHLPVSPGKETSDKLLVHVEGCPPTLKRKPHFKFLYLILIISIAVNVGLGIYCVFIYVTQSQPRNLQLVTSDRPRGTMEVAPSDVCVLCGSLGLRRGSTALGSSGLHLVEGNGEEEDLCCRENAESLQLLLQVMEILNRTKPADIPRQENSMFRMPNPAAHLFLDQRLNNLSAPLAWTDKTGSGVAHNTGNAIYLSSSGCLYIPKDGLYFVYSALTFKVRQNLPSKLDLLHSLRKSDGEVLLMRKSTLPERAETFASSFLSGILRLRAGDKIGVSVSNVTFVYDFWPTSYFGLLKVDDYSGA